jgi:hypothetical protein
MGPEKIQQRFLPIGIGLNSALPLAAAPLSRAITTPIAKNRASQSIAGFIPVFVRRMSI